MTTKKARPNKLTAIVLDENIEQFNEIIPESNLEETLFVHLPKVREMIREARDVTQSFESLAREVGVSKNKFYSIYRAAKKEALVQTEVRLGDDKRMELLTTADEEIAKYKAERRAFKQAVEEARKKAKEEGLDKLDPVEMQFFAMKPDVAASTLLKYDALIKDMEARKSKLLGIEHERKVVLSDDVQKMLDKMMDKETQLQYLKDCESPDIIDADFEEIVPINGKEDE